MSTALVQITKVAHEAARLKPEVRLIGAVSDFALQLDKGQRNRFKELQTQSSPSGTDYLKLTAEINQDGLRLHRSWGRFGTRLVRFLEGIQLLTKVGDVLVGGSQNMIASGVWASVHLSLRAATSYFAYFDKVSQIFMKLGRSSAIQQDLVALFPGCRDLHDFMCEYLILVVQFCQKIMSISKKPLISQVGSVFSTSLTGEFTTFETNLAVWATLIKEKVNLLTTESTLNSGKAVEKTNRLLTRYTVRDNQNKQDEATALKNAIFEALSPHQQEFDDTWRHERRKGDAIWIQQEAQYLEWKCSTSPTLLWITGSLGSGKTVLMANIVENLHTLIQATKPPAVAHAFCRYKDANTLQPRNIVGSILNQFLKHLGVECKDQLASISLDVLKAKNIEPVVDWALRILPAERTYFVILDSLEECSLQDAELMFQFLRTFSQARTCRICCSIRHAAQISPISDVAVRFFPSSTTISMNSTARDEEMKIYIENELHQRQDIRPIDAETLQALKDALLLGAAGMYLWVALQIESIFPRYPERCLSQADIRNVLTNLPKDLPEAFERAIENITDKRYGSKIFQLIAAAERPLSVNEIRIALSVEPGNAVWDPTQVLDNTTKLLVKCGGALLDIDEETETVYFIHHSALEYLFATAGSDSYGFSNEQAEALMTGICITYLNYNIHDRQVATFNQRQVIKPSHLVDTVATSVSAEKSHSMKAMQMAATLFRKRRSSTSGIDVSTLIDRLAKYQASPSEDAGFLDYSQTFWLKHTRLFKERNSSLHKLFQKLVNHPPPHLTVPWSNSSASYWAVRNGHFGVFHTDLLVLPNEYHSSNDEFVSHQSPNARLINSVSTWYDTYNFSDASAILRALGADSRADPINTTRYEAFVYSNSIPKLWETAPIIIRCVLSALLRTESPPNSTSDVYSRGRLLHIATKRGWPECVTLLAAVGEDVNASYSSDKNTPLYVALMQNDREIVEALLEAGANTGCLLWNTHTSLTYAIGRCSISVASLLIRYGASFEENKEGQTPLGLAIAGGQESLCAELLEAGADPNAWHMHFLMDFIDFSRLAVGRSYSPLSLALGWGNETVCDLLITYGADVKRHPERQGPLAFAIQSDFSLSFVSRLIAAGANIEASAGDTSPLCAAAVRLDGRLDLLDLLLEHGADPNREEGGITPLLAAIAVGVLRPVAKLISFGASPSKAARGLTPLGMALELGLIIGIGGESITACLINVSARIDDAYYWKGFKKLPLFTAIERGWSQVVRRLLAHGASTSILEAQSTALASATDKAHLGLEHLDIVNALIEHGAAVVEKDSAVFEQPLVRAVKQGNFRLALMFLRKGNFDSPEIADLVTETLLSAFDCLLSAPMKTRYGNGLALALLSGATLTSAHLGQMNFFLLKAVAWSSSILVRKLLRLGCDPNAAAPATWRSQFAVNTPRTIIYHGEHALDIATRLKDGHKCIRLLLEFGADPNLGAPVKCTTRWSCVPFLPPVWRAGLRNDEVAVSLLMDAGACRLPPCRDRCVPLLANPLASTRRATDPLQLALLAGPAHLACMAFEEETYWPCEKPFNAVSLMGFEPGTVAEMVECFLDLGCPFECANENIARLIANLSEPVAMRFLDEALGIVKDTNFDPYLLVHATIKQAFPRVMGKILDHYSGALPKNAIFTLLASTDIRGRRADAAECIRILLMHGADPDDMFARRVRYKPWVYAFEHRLPEAGILLLDNSLSIDPDLASSEQSNNPLLWMAGAKNVKAFRAIWDRYARDSPQSEKYIQVASEYLANKVKVRREKGLGPCPEFILMGLYIGTTLTNV